MKNLSDEQKKILFDGGTEAPFSSKLLHEKGVGVYRCANCDSALFDSSAKFDSGTGWPSFDQALPGAIINVHDSSHGMERTEIKCATCNAHLGHVFSDLPTGQAGGPTPTGQRYCLNGLCLDLEKK